MDIEILSENIELVSERYAEKFNIERTSDWLILKLHEEVGELTQAYLARMGQGRDKGLSDAELESDLRAEMADVFAHVLLLAKRFEIDLQTEIEHKWLIWKNKP